MIQSVRYYKVFCFQHTIIPGDLIKGLLPNSLPGCFAFYQDMDAAIGVIDHNIKATTHPVQQEHLFDLYPTCRIFLIRQEKMKDMLTHPFLGLQADKFFPNDVKDEGFIFCTFKAEGIGPEIQVGQGGIWFLRKHGRS